MPEERTLETLRRFVKRRIKRADMDDNILENAIDTYRTICGLIPFVNLRDKIDNIPLIQNEPVVSLAGMNIAGIMSIRLQKAGMPIRRLRRSDTRAFDAIAYTQPAPPALYARGVGPTIEVHPPANADDYTLRIRCWIEPTIIDTPDESTTELLWPAAWDSLGKYETLYRTYIDLDEHEKASWLMQPAMIPRQPGPKKTRSFEVGTIPRLWNDLLLIEVDREAVDEDYSVKPLVRNYSMR